ncbi:MAG: hypothetical protein M3355_10815 [Actinomycetota bacterium]|nr:hypothetical protein [Actinomycetota bacterium]
MTTKNKPVSRSRYVPVWLDPEDQRRLEAKAIARGYSRSKLAEELIQHGLGYPGVSPPEAGRKQGRSRREAIAGLADREDEFSVEEAMEATGLKRAVTSHHLREMVWSGLLSERVVPNSCGNEKRYQANKT